MELLSIVSWVTFVVSSDTDQDKLVTGKLLSCEFLHIDYLLVGADYMGFFSQDITKLFSSASLAPEIDCHVRKTCRNLKLSKDLFSLQFFF